MGKDFDTICKELIELTNRFNLNIVIGNKPTFKNRQYMIRFSMPRRWGGVKKYACGCTVENLKTYVEQIEKVGGKVIAID